MDLLWMCLVTPQQETHYVPASTQFMTEARPSGAAALRLAYARLRSAVPKGAERG